MADQPFSSMTRDHHPHILPTEAWGLHVDHAHGACEIGKTGDLAYVYTAPPPKALLRASRDGPTHKDECGCPQKTSSVAI